jgi:two-component system, NarL family, invasion response regulator UvrY
VNRSAAADSPAETSQRSVLLVDDHHAFRLAVRSLLDSEPAYVVVAEAADGEEAVDLALELRPDLVLMDVRLPGINGVEATRRILAREPSTTVVLLSTLRRVDLPSDLLECGAVGFLQKEAVGPVALERLIGTGEDRAQQ